MNELQCDGVVVVTKIGNNKTPPQKAFYFPNPYFDYG
jgi:hypothetical protein